MSRLKIDTDFNPNIEKAAMTVAPLFNLFGWTWSSAKNGVPTLHEIEEHIEDQVKELLKKRKRGYWISSGRIKSELCFDGMVEYIEVSLVLEDIHDDRSK